MRLVVNTARVRRMLFRCYFSHAFRNVYTPECSTDVPIIEPNNIIRFDAITSLSVDHVVRAGNGLLIECSRCDDDI